MVHTIYSVVTTCEEIAPMTKHSDHEIAKFYVKHLGVSLFLFCFTGAPTICTKNVFFCIIPIGGVKDKRGYHLAVIYQILMNSINHVACIVNTDDTEFSWNFTINARPGVLKICN